MDEFDVIVVGGGSGGSAVAGRLSADAGLTVCLIEAGGTNANWRITTPGMMAAAPKASNWAFETVPQAGLDGRRGFQPRGRGLGGSSAINAMLYVRGNRWDYDNWAALGCTDWSYADVLPFFRATEDNEEGTDEYHGVGGPLSVSNQRHVNPASRAFVAAAESLQIAANADFNGPRQDGVGLYQVTQRGGERWSAARAFLDPARSRPNLDIRTGAMVERVVVEHGRATGVVVRDRRGSRTLRARGAVVMAGGAFGTPQTLMLSGIGPGAHLRDHGIDVAIDRPAVGSDLQDHPDYVSTFASPRGDLFGRSLGGYWRTLKAIVEHRRRRTGAMTTPYAEAGGFWRIDPDAPAADIQWHFVPAILEDHGRVAVKGHGFSAHVCVLRPESRGTVRLASANAAVAPLIDPAFLQDPRDIATLREGVRLTHRICTAAALSPWTPVDRTPVDLRDDAALDALIRSRADTVYHPVGTCRMGSDTAAVCDPRLRVNGVAGLYVADASVMPRLVSGNTNAPTIMIAERCARFIAEDLH